MSEKSEKKDIYFTATGEIDGLPLIFRSSLKTGVHEPDYPYLVTVYWDYETDDKNGMPTEETNEAQVIFEDALEPLQAEAFSHLMLVVTGNGQKEWNWYVSDVESWMEQFNELISDHPDYPLEIENSFEPDWASYHNFISGVKGIESINQS